jgi:DNA-binding transcriptional ArsR family regulator
MSTRGRPRPRDRVPAKTCAGAPPVSDAFGAIAHPLRRQIVVALAAGEMAVRDLAESLPVTRPAVSQHLRVMLKVGLVTQQRVGRENHYRLHPQRLDEIRHWLTSLDSSWAAAMKRLGEHLERTS